LPDKVIHCPSACCGRKLDKLRPQYCRDVASHTHLHRTDSQGRNDPLDYRVSDFVLWHEGVPSDAPRKACLLRC
jgi:hypothetical protein